MLKKIFGLLIFLLTFNNFVFACDFTQPDKIKHIQVAKKSTAITKKVVKTVFIPTYPVKWLFNPTVQKIFPDEYIPHIVAGSLVFTAGVLKEVPYDLLTPGTVSFCDIQADCKGIKEGLAK